MKLFCTHRRKKTGRGGFSLVEATFSIGLLSFSVLTLAPLLAVGMKSARQARTEQTSAQIAQTLGEEAKEGTLPPNPLYLDETGASCGVSQAAYTAQATTDSPAAEVTRVTLRVTPVGAPDRARIYAVLFASQN